MSNHHRRGPWSQQEDQILMSLVQTQGPLNWVRIAHLLASRTPKQCRERYHQNLKPSLSHEPITPEEGREIERLVDEVGKRWAEIARRLQGRSDNAVKNWWNGSQNRRKRMDRRKVTPGYSSVYEDQRPDAYYARPPAPPPLAIPRTLPPPLRQVPPQSPSYNRHYSFDTPLPSPSALSPGADSVDMAPPSLMSDSGSCYTTSPRAPLSHPGSPISLPPLKNLTSQSSHFPQPISEQKLPGLQYMMPVKPESRQSAPPMMEPGYEHSQAQRLPPTVPSSPVNLPSLRRTGSQEGQLGEKDARFNVSRLLN